MKLQAVFPTGQSSKVSVALADALREKYKLNWRDGFWVVSAGKSADCPDALSLVITAPGFKKQVLNRILNQGKPYRDLELPIRIIFEPDSAPAIAQIVAGHVEGQVGFDVTLEARFMRATRPLLACVFDS